jgi:hypothetical protein
MVEAESASKKSGLGNKKPRSSPVCYETLGGPLFQKYGVYLDRVTLAQPPYKYESRLRDMFPGAFQNLRLMALDPYDLALTKLEDNIETEVTCGTWLVPILSIWSCFVTVVNAQKNGNVCGSRSFRHKLKADHGNMVGLFRHSG